MRDNERDDTKVLATEELEGPVFLIGEAAKFFDRNVQWLRWREQDRSIWCHKDGSPIEIKRLGQRGKTGGYRYYTLQNLTDIADALLRNDKLTTRQYNIVLSRIKAFSSPLYPEKGSRD